MKIHFRVHAPKIDKRKINRGEDAPPVSKDGILIICDGTGASGQAEHTISGETYTSAYLGARITSKIAEDFLSENYELFIGSFSDADGIKSVVSSLGNAIRKGLSEYARANKLTMTVHGKSFRLLPTTFTAVVYQACETTLQAIVLSAGDSRALWWDADGLHQLSTDDVDQSSLSAGDCSAGNCISADSDFQISFCCYQLPPKGILFATSDGFTDPVRPFEQERYLIEWMGNFKNICEPHSQQLSDEIACKLDSIGFTRRDDCSIAGVILGYLSDEELKNKFRKRYKTELIAAYLKPYREIGSQIRETEAQLDEAEAALHKRKNKIVAVIRNGISDYLKNHCHPDTPNGDALFQTLIRTDIISTQIGKELRQIESDVQEKKRIYTQTQSDLKTGYLDFLMLLCRDFGKVRFSDELIEAVHKYQKTKDTLQACSRTIGRELSALKRLETTEEILGSDFLEPLAESLEKLTSQVNLAKSNYQEYEENETIVRQYFSFQNDEVVRFYQEDLQNSFSVLKKTSRFPLLASGKQRALKSQSQTLLRLYETTEQLKNETSDAFVQKREAAAYRRTIAQYSGEIAEELFYKDKYWDYLPENLNQTDVPQLSQYRQIKNGLQSLFVQRTNLEVRYGKQYEKFLLNALVQGKIIFKI